MKLQSFCLHEALRHWMHDPMTPLSYTMSKQKNNRFIHVWVAVILTTFIALPAHAAVGVTSSELQSSIDLVTPSGDSLVWDQVDYQNFSLESSSVVSGGVQLVYEARLSEDPLKGDSLPHTSLTILAYEDQDAAQAFFDGYLDAIYASGSRSILVHDDRAIFYESRDEKGDLLGSLSTEQDSYHLLHINGNLLYEANFYQEDALLPIQSNLELFESMASDYESTYVLLDELTETVKVGLSLLFPPTNSELQTSSDISSMNLSELYDVPGNGTMSFDLYVGELNGAAGTVLDSSGLLTAVDGDMYLYLSSSGLLQVGLYSPDYDSDCDKQSGWTRLTSTSSVNAYEWNEIVLNYGTNGLGLSVNGNQMSCNLWQSYSEWELYLGDYPDDSLEQSFIGRLDNVAFNPIYAVDGRTWDEVFDTQIFYDLDAEDADFSAFEALHNQGVFMGSQGYVYPDKSLNRAEMVKVLLKAFGISTSGSEITDFPDVPGGIWYESYVGRALEIGMIEGQEDGTFTPENTINRAEFYTMLYRLSGLELELEVDYRDVDEDDWFIEAASFAELYNLVDNSRFDPEREVRRRDAAAALYTLMNASIL